MLILWLAGLGFAVAQIGENPSASPSAQIRMPASLTPSARMSDPPTTANPSPTPQPTSLLTPSPSLTAVPTTTPQQIAVEPLAGARLVTLSAGEHVGYQFDADGAVIAHKSAALRTESAAHASQRATVRGERYLLIVDGIWADYYLPESERVRLGG